MNQKNSTTAEMSASHMNLTWNQQISGSSSRFLDEGRLSTVKWRALFDCFCAWELFSAYTTRHFSLGEKMISLTFLISKWIDPDSIRCLKRWQWQTCCVCRINHGLPNVSLVSGIYINMLVNEINQWHVKEQTDYHLMEHNNKMSKETSCWNCLQTCLFDFSVFLSWVFCFHTWFPFKAMLHMMVIPSGDLRGLVRTTAPVRWWTTPTTGVSSIRP